MFLTMIKLVASEFEFLLEESLINRLDKDRGRRYGIPIYNF
jgi:hypothetical protein